MTTLLFLAEWALRSSILILSGALLLRALRVKDPAMRLAAWTVLLTGSLAIPALTVALPKVPVGVAASRITAERISASGTTDDTHRSSARQAAQLTPFDWGRAALMVYGAVALALLLRLCVGLALGLRLLHGSRSTGETTEGIEIRESRHLTAPVTLGIAWPAIVLPRDWRDWERSKLDAVLAHERSHIGRHDPAVQLLSAVHRALLWFSPLSWYLHRQIVRVAEEASDDAAVAATADRALYAGVLLDFMQRGVRNPAWQGVPMARYGRQDERIQRILDGTVLSRGVTRRGMAAIVALALPAVWLAAAAVRPAAIEPIPQSIRVAAAVAAPAAAAQVTAAPRAAYLQALGSVSAQTVTIRPRIDGQLMSLPVKEGDLVQAGQVVATIDPGTSFTRVNRAQAQLETDQAQLADLNTSLQRLVELQAKNLIPREKVEEQKAAIALVEDRMKADQADAFAAKLQLSYTQITAPISGIAGLRMVGVGNIVHAADTGGIFTITQLQPIAIVFSIPQDELPQVRARLAQGASPRVEAWNRDDSKRVAVGRLTAMDNQIDLETGTVKLKAQFENQDGALFPNQFVNVHLFLK